MREQTLLERRYGANRSADEWRRAKPSGEFSTSRNVEWDEPADFGQHFSPPLSKWRGLAEQDSRVLLLHVAGEDVLWVPAWRRTLPFGSVPDNVNLRAQGSFPATRWSLIAAARSAEPEARQRALEILVAAYWKPVYKYVRLRWEKDNEQAQDLTQEFFLRLLEKDFLAKYDPQRARLRTFLRVCVDHLIANEDKAARRLKRGGEVQFLPLDFESAEGELRQVEIPSPSSMEDFFEREWVRSIFSLSLERLRQECEPRGKLVHFRLLEFYDIDEAGKELTYEQVARQFGLKPSDVTNYLAFARREFRRIVLDQLREMTGSEEEFRRETQTLLGIDAP